MKNKSVYICLVLGFIFGLILFRLNKSIFLSEGRYLFSGISLEEGPITQNALFVLLILKRIGSILWLIFLATTYLGAVIVAYRLTKYGFDLAIMLNLLLDSEIKEMLKGGIAGLFIMGFIYTLAFIGATNLGMDIYLDIYIKRQPEKMKKYFLRLFVIVLILLFGICAEMLFL